MNETESGEPLPIPVDPPPTEPRVASEQVREPFRFTGDGGEYFRIWIVNLLLTILTLGIYSAWAKVRRLQYFYRNTHLANASFDYHGSPVALLKGRLIALFLLAAYTYSFQIFVELGWLTLIVLAILLPRLLRNSLRFRLHNSSYRGLRFNFTGSVEEAYAAFLFGPILTGVTLYLAAPHAHQRLKRYQHDGSRYGQTPFAFSATAGQFYRAYLLPSGLLVLGLLGLVVSSKVTQQADGQAGAAVAIAFIFFVFVSLFLGPLWQARIQNLVWNETTLGPHRFSSDISATRLFGIYATNFIGILLTLGLFIPWATVRLARYRVQAMSLTTQGSLDELIAAKQQAESATGEETAEMFDIDIAF